MVPEQWGQHFEIVRLAGRTNEEASCHGISVNVGVGGRCAAEDMHKWLILDRWGWITVCCY